MCLGFAAFSPDKICRKQISFQWFRGCFWSFCILQTVYLAFSFEKGLLQTYQKFCPVTQTGKLSQAWEDLNTKMNLVLFSTLWLFLCSKYLSTLHCCHLKADLERTKILLVKNAFIWQEKENSLRRKLECSDIIGVRQHRTAGTIQCREMKKKKKEKRRKCWARRNICGQSMYIFKTFEILFPSRP